MKFQSRGSLASGRSPETGRKAVREALEAFTGEVSARSTAGQRLRAGRVRRIQAIVPRRGQQLHELPAAAFAAGRQIQNPAEISLELLDRCAVAYRPRLPQEHRKIVQDVVEDLALREAAGVLRARRPVVLDLDPVRPEENLNRLPRRRSVDAVLIAIEGREAGRRRRGLHRPEGFERPPERSQRAALLLERLEDAPAPSPPDAAARRPRGTSPPAGR